MRSAGPRIDRYLRRVAGQSLAEPGELTAVCGGPAADPDSVAGSLAYAFLLHQEQEARSQGLKRLIAPILPIPRAELRLRPEVLTLLEAAEVPPGVLAGPESLDLSTHPSERLALVLVDGDGRELPAKLRQRVVEILDHHVPAARLPAGTRRIVAPVGSACTLVAEQILERLPGLLEQRLALLLLGPILLDTVNLDPAAGRATERDWQAAARLREAAGAGSAGLYALLREARDRLEGLSGAELLRRDYKESTAGGARIGIASLPLSAQEWWSREQDAEACLRGLAERRGLAVLALMFAFGPAGGSRAGGAEFRRQLLLLVRGAGRYRALLRFLAALGLGLRPLHAWGKASGGEAAWSGEAARGEWQLGLFEQGDSAFSRKRLEPELRRFCISARGSGHGG